MHATSYEASNSQVHQQLMQLHPKHFPTLHTRVAVSLTRSWSIKRPHFYIKMKLF